jgi:diguanylate cyclase (GGDEF)-like protein/PAS domain S-box-containing protein
VGAELTQAQALTISEESAPAHARPARLARAYELAEELGRIGFYEIDFAARRTLVSPTCLAQFGLEPPRDWLSFDRWSMSVHPDDRPRMFGYLDRLAKGDDQDAVEYRIVRPDGAVRWMWARTRIDYDPAGAPRWGHGVQQDVTERRLAEDALRESELRFRTVAELASDLLYAYDVDGGRIEWFGEVDRLFGYAPGLFPRTLAAWEAHIRPDDRAHVLAALDAHIEHGEPFAVEYRTLSLDGSVRHWIDRGRLIAALDGSRVMVGAMTDVTERRQSVQALAESEARFRHLADHMPAMTWMTRADGTTEYLSRSWYEATGQSEETGLGHGWLAAVHRDDLKRVVTEVTSAGRAQRPVQNDFRVIRADGETRWVLNHGLPRYDHDGHFLGFVGSLLDITERKAAEERLAWTAEHDGLTGLANRTRFQKELKARLAAAERDAARTAVILLDLDHLKLVNDTLGHDAGDALITAVAGRLQAAVGGEGLVARLGGDEFGIILGQVEGRASAVRRACALADALNEPLLHQGEAIDCRSSVGITLAPDDSMDPEELLKNADLALYTAKSSDRGSVVPYRPRMRRELRQRVRTRKGATRFLAEDRILPFYQPQVDLGTGKLHGFEALMRLRGTRGGLHAPRQLMSAFDDPKLAIALGDRMLDLVLRDLAHWLETGGEPGRIAINASAIELRAGGYAERVLARLNAAGLAPGLLEIEVTETVLMGRDSAQIGAALQALSAAGVRLSLDDFGTGYASLTYLKQFPVDAIKIDRSFVAGLGSDEGDQAIVSAIVGLGRTLGKQVIAEGVESREQAEWLASIGCRLAQGFYFARPLSLAQAMEFGR